MLLVAMPGFASSIPCVGDCANDDRVTVDELVKGVTIALGHASVDECRAFDRSGNDLVTVDELVAGMNTALNGCVPDSACDDHNPCTVDRFVSGGTCENTLSALPCTDGPATAPMYAGVWTDDDAERDIIRDQDVDALLATWESQSAAGFRLISVDGRESSTGLVTFDSLFKANDARSHELYVTTGRAAFDAQVSSLDEQGKQLIHFDQPHTGGAPRGPFGDSPNPFQ